MNPEFDTKNQHWTALTDDERKRLQAIGLPDTVYNWFLETFVPHPFDFVVDRGSGWRFKNQRIGHDLVLRHLEGSALVGVGYAPGPYRTTEVASHFIIDLDAGPSLDVRLDAVRMALGEPVAFRSSDSEGLHLYYFLERPVEALELYHPVTGDGLLPRILTQHGARLEPGVIEVLPTGAHMDANGEWCFGQRGRLPGGRGSLLLDPQELLRISADGPDALVRAHDLFQRQYVERLEVERLREEAARSNRPGRKPKSRHTRSSGKLANVLADLSHRYDTIGLEREGQLHQAAIVRATDFAQREVPLPEATVLQLAWLEEKHNGNSRTYNADPEAARKEVVRILEWVYKKWCRRKVRARRPGITAYEAASIHAATAARGVDLVDVLTGQRFAREKVEHFMCEMVCGMKQWVMDQALRVAERIVRRHPRLTIGSSAFNKKFLADVRRFWPHPPAPLFIVDNPYAFRRTISGVGEESLSAMWRVAQSTGFFRRHRRAHQYSGQCEAFEARLDFRQSPQGTSDTIAEALLNLLPPGEMQEAFGMERSRRLQRKGKRAISARYGFTKRTELTAYVDSRLEGACPKCAAASAGEALEAAGVA